ncbi:MAG: hypothetical protein H6810_00125 [Phycisphaeraceae bacterium]|nr:MAG: hypothetical protein H6810_00125 [Phycisphaeraceae bacterium]
MNERLNTIAWFDRKRDRSGFVPNPIQPSESPYQFLDRRDDTGHRIARTNWNRCLAALSRIDAARISRRLLSRNGDQVYAAYSEICLLDYFKRRGIDAYLLDDNAIPDLAVPTEIGTIFVEIKTKRESQERQHAEKQLRHLLNQAAKRVRNRNIRCAIMTYTPSQGSPSGRSLSDFINRVDEMPEAERPLNYDGDLQWQDSASGAAMTFSLMYVTSNISYRTIQGTGPTKFVWMRGKEQLESITSFVAKQHKQRNFVIPAVAWHDFVHEPDRDEIRSVAQSRTPYGLLWLTHFSPWADPVVELFPRDGFVPDPFNRLLAK